MHFDSVIGIEIVSKDSGRATIELQITDQHLNLRGITHGGVICSLLDDVIGAAIHSALQPGTYASTADLTIHFLRPAVKGKLRAEGRVIRQGRRLVVGEGTVYNAEGKAVAHGVGTWAVVSVEQTPDTGEQR